jgi:hypothetical protein
MKASEKTLNLVKSIKEKEHTLSGYASNQIGNDFLNLINGKKVEVGYRAGCGGTDKTHKVFKEWLKVLKALRKDGFQIKETNVLHDNKSPTMSQGFWNSIIYEIETQPESF